MKPTLELTRKREAIEKCVHKLQHTIQANSSATKLNTVAENVRKVRLSFLKADLHWAQEARFTRKFDAGRQKNIEKEIQKWTLISVEQIIQLYKETEQDAAANP